LLIETAVVFEELNTFPANLVALGSWSHTYIGHKFKQVAFTFGLDHSSSYRVDLKATRKILYNTAGPDHFQEADSMVELDYSAELSRLLSEMQGEQGDAHEILMRLKQLIATMRAEGLPVPQDFKNLEAGLDKEFEVAAKNRP